MAVANGHLTNPQTMEGGKSQRTESDGQGEENPTKERISQLQLEEVGRKIETKFDCVANTLFVRLEENVKAREQADLFSVHGSSLNGFCFQPPGCGPAGL